jgi:hypothetical protein
MAEYCQPTPSVCKKDSTIIVIEELWNCVKVFPNYLTKFSNVVPYALIMLTAPTCSDRIKWNKKRIRNVV